MSDKLLIMVIDDDEQVVAILLRMIARLGHTALRVLNTQVRDLIAAGGKPDLIITDIFMPKVEGLSIIRSLKSSEYGDIPILAISGGGRTFGKIGDVTDSYVAKAAVDFGAAQFLPKPFSLQQLDQAINECHRKPHTRQLAISD